MSDTAGDTLRQEEIALLIRDVPQAQEYPRLAADLACALRGVAKTTGEAVLPQLIQALLTSVDPPRAVNHLLRYLENLADPTAFWKLCAQQPQALASVVCILAGSQFLNSLLWRRPHLLFWLLTEALWAARPTPHVLAAQLAELLQGQEEDAEVAVRLRAFTYQHLLRIGARDLCDLADVEDVTADLSALADCVVQAALTTCQGWLTAAHGAPVYTDDAGIERPCGFCVIGMGKLGGYELNFSSDIDLMYVYTSYQGQTRGVMQDGQQRGQLSNHEYFVALARRLTTLVGGNGPDGQAFRVDLRLRPEGTQGQLTLSLMSYEAYYTRLGQTWEKMALLKARPIAGDAQLGEEFLALIHPFVYQRHLDPEGIRHLQEIKQQIDVQLADKAQAHTNVKLGLGGIREIEFLIQLPQLLFGGRQPALQERHSLRALTTLCEAGLLTPEVTATLRDAYCYLRRLEHRLQMEQGAQTHMLPQRPEQRLRLARHCGHATWEAFYADYLVRTEVVHAIFVEAFQDHRV